MQLTPLQEALSTPPSPLSPEAALRYFLGLVPTIGADPQRFGHDQRRHAFTLAAATEQELLARVHEFIRGVLQTGEQAAEAPSLLRQLLNDAGVTPRNPGYAEMVFRTNAVDAYNTGAWDEMTDPDVADSFPVWEYSAVVDSRSRPAHAARNGKYYPASVPFAQVRGTKAADVINCVLPGMAVQGRFVGGLKASYAGQAIEIRTRAGHRLALTVNHPVLAEDGWLLAGEVKQGDHLASYRGDAKRLATGEDVDDAPALIEQVFDSLADGLTLRVKPSGVDLHGDGQFVQGHIEVVAAHRAQPRSRNAGARQSGDQEILPLACVQLPDETGCCSLRLHGERIPLASPSDMCRPDLPLPAPRISYLVPLELLCLALCPGLDPFVQETEADDIAGNAQAVSDSLFRLPSLVPVGNGFGVDLKSPEPCCLGSASQLDVLLTEPAGYGVPFDSEFFGKLVHRFPGTVTLDEVIEVRRFHYHGPVYDLETMVGYYTIFSPEVAKSSIVIKNCRCTFIPIHIDEWRALRRRGARIAPGYADVPAQAVRQ